MKMGLIIAALIVLAATMDKYTNDQAFQCFAEKGLPSC
jgi:hypothetical protein